jgi:hypothetical protein
MQAVLTVAMDNAAFTEYTAGELARILRALADTVERDSTLGVGDSFGARDGNGNKVGALEVTE